MKNSNLTAKQAIDKIKSVKITIFGQEATKYNYAVQVREELQGMSERNEISPSEYKKALDITWEQMGDAEKESEVYGN